MSEAHSSKNDGYSQLVIMEDGRQVEFNGKQRVKMEGYREGVIGELVVRFSFVNGAVITYEIPPALYGTFALHGAMKALGEPARDCRSVDDMVHTIRRLASRFTDEERWNAEREGTEVDLLAVTHWAL